MQLMTKYDLNIYIVYRQESYVHFLSVNTNSNIMKKS